MNKEYIPYVSIRPHYLSLYSLPVEKRVPSERQIENMKNLSNNDHKGEISQKAEKRIRNAIHWLLALSKEKPFYAPKYHRKYKFKINFVTLTLSSAQIHSDNEIKKTLLNHFLIECKNRWKVKHYLWRAESQKNGNIHFHICTDAYIPWQELRNVWNRIQNKLGYIDRFHAKYKHRVPNSTDVHALKKIKNIAAYLSKYCTKQDPIRAIEGKLWGLSNGLSRLKSSVHMIWSNLWEELNEIQHKFKNHVKEYDYATCIYIDVKKWSKVVNGHLFRLYNEFLQSVNNPLSPELNIPLTAS